MSEKQNKKENKRKWQMEQKALFRNSLPVDEAVFPRLFSYLETELDTCNCNHDLSIVEKFCDAQDIDFSKLQVWLREHGGYCDCEVLANVEDLFQYLEPPVVYESRLKVDAKEKLNFLVTDYGFEICNIPAPWLLYKVTKKNKTTYRFQIGKKTDLFNYTVLRGDWSLKKLNTEEAFLNYWRKEVELDDVDLVIEEAAVQEFRQVSVKSIGLSPVIIFTFRKDNPKWVLIMRSETPRIKGDLRELDNLLRSISI